MLSELSQIWKDKYAISHIWGILDLTEVENRMDVKRGWEEKAGMGKPIYSQEQDILKCYCIVEYL